ncbi:MAG: hypothetical protein IKU86_00695, partial [Thermoguttaceae bacterium]|nr:hypothetical protein [Thermoguttaceae bacterium]
MSRNRSDAAPSEPSSSLSLFGDFTEQTASADETSKKSAKKGTKTAKKPRSAAKKAEQPEKSDDVSAAGAPSLDLFGALTEAPAETAQAQEIAKLAQSEQAQAQEIAKLAQSEP